MNPFSILDTRTKDWQARKRYWLDTFNIKSELGREETESKVGFWENNQAVSVFDPVLTELMMTWFCPPNGKILDPFAGGSVRGIVATELGFEYTGIDISEKQIEANRSQSNKPKWITGDSRWILENIERNSYDFVFTCPPYHDLEVYSDNPKDLSTMPYNRFLTSLNSILYKSTLSLKDNRFFGIVVSEIRDSGSTRDYKIGKYRNFVSSVIEICEEHGLHFYNDMVLFNSQHQASRTNKTYFNRNRKIASVHQNVLIFVKGNPDLATEVINWDGIYKCEVDGVKYRSFREASISINHDELGVSEVKRRCESRKSKYEGWQTLGNETRPNIRYMIGISPFESFKQMADITGLTEGECSTRINSNNMLYRHWSKVDSDSISISYNQMRRLQEQEIPLQLPIISCEDMEFYSTHEAGKYFGLSKERIRQKLKDSNYPDYKYLT